MKLRLIALAAGVALMGQAQALTVAQAQATPLQIYISGSSALKAVIGSMVVQNTDPATFTQFKSNAASFGDSSNGSSYNIYTGTLTAGNDFGLPAGTNIVVHTRQKGGSYFGVTPVATGTAIAFMDLASCDDTTKVCTATVNQVADAGVSDLEPSMFSVAQNVPSGQPNVTVSGSSFSSVKVVGSQVYGVAASKALANALAAQGLNGVTSTGVATILKQLYSAANGWKPLGLTTATGVNIIRRANGSGSQAGFNLKFFDLGSSTLATLPGAASNTSSGVTDITTTAGKIYINEASSADNVIAKLNQADAAGAYALGVLTLDKDPNNSANGTGWTFLTLDGVAPSRANMQNGSYNFYYESTCQVSPAYAGVSSDKATLVNAFCAQMGLSKNLAQNSTEAQNGLAASAGNCAGTAASWVGTDAAFCAKVTRSGDSRKPSVQTKF